ncbi:MAG: carbohydrate kinase family protein [Planctomycetaceae bacterium]|nr:carbohydrate kinase family protein [Planctomycetaceae bacterium]
MTDRWDCLCAGIIVADQVCEPIVAIPPAGGLSLTPRLTFTIGGCAANVAVDLVKLGLRVGVSGCVGTDLFGRALADLLTTAGVDCTGLSARPEQPTSGTFVINVQGEDRRFIHCVGANALYDGTQITDADLARTRVLYVGGYCLLETLTPARVSELFQRARAAGVTTMLDVVVGSRAACWEWVAPVLPWTDVFLPNHDEATVIAGGTDPWEQARRFRAAGCGTVMITCGADGAIYDGPAGRCRVGTFPVTAVDPTGTGDAFVAGYVYGLLKGHSPAACLKYGSALGASCVQAIGATTGVFHAAELESFVASHSLIVEEW